MVGQKGGRGWSKAVSGPSGGTIPPEKCSAGFGSKFQPVPPITPLRPRPGGPPQPAGRGEALFWCQAERYSSFGGGPRFPPGGFLGFAQLFRG